MSIIFDTMNDLKERIERMASFYDISMRKFEEKCSLNRGNLSNMTGSLGSDKVSKIHDACPEISLEWLLTGRGDMLKSQNKEEATVDTSIKKGADQFCRPIAIPSASSLEGIPLIPFSAMAGMMSGEITAMEYECERYVIPAFKGAEFLIPVKGSSMTPKYSSGDIVACKHVSMSDLFFQWGKVYVLNTDQGALIKRIKPTDDPSQIMIVSDNPTYDPFPLPLTSIYSVALVIGVIRLE